MRIARPKCSAIKATLVLTEKQICLYWFTHQVALIQFTSESAKMEALSSGFNTFRHHTQILCPPERDNRRHDRRVFRIGFQLAHERTVNL